MINQFVCAPVFTFNGLSFKADFGYNFNKKNIITPKIKAGAAALFGWAAKAAQVC